MKFNWLRTMGFVFGIFALLLAAGCGCGDDDDSADDAAPADDTADDTQDDDQSDDSIADDDVADDSAGDDTQGDDTSIDDTADDTQDDDAVDDDTEVLDCPAVITRQPYLQLLTKTSVNILWRTDQPADTVVEWGLTADLGHLRADHELTKSHEIKIPNLEPGTEYYYRVRSCLFESSIAVLRTAPAGDEPFTFVAFGDNQDGYEIFTQIVPLMIDQNPRIALSVGDIVSDGWQEDLWDLQLFVPAENLLRTTPLYVGIGNHEALAPYFFSNFHFPNGRWEYYSFTYANVFFLALAQDTTHWTLPGTPQYNFMVDALSSDEAQNADFRIVFFHTPPWSEGWPGYTGDWLVRTIIVPVMEQYHVDAYFNGHTHDYERGLLNGVTSYIIGGAGGGLDVWARDVAHITVYNAIHHFLRVSVDGPTMTLDAIDIDGNLFDTWQITH